MTIKIIANRSPSQDSNHSNDLFQSRYLIILFQNQSLFQKKMCLEWFTQFTAIKLLENLQNSMQLWTVCFQHKGLSINFVLKPVIPSKMSEILKCERMNLHLIKTIHPLAWLSNLVSKIRRAQVTKIWDRVY